MTMIVMMTVTVTVIVTVIVIVTALVGGGDRDYDEDDYDPRPAAAAGPAGKSNAAGLTLSIIGLVFGTCALLFSFIPCIGALALWPGIVAVVISGIGLMTSVRAKALPITAVAVSALSIGFALWQRSRVEAVVDDLEKGAKQFQKDLKEGTEAWRKEMERLEKERLDKLKKDKQDD